MEKKTFDSKPLLFPMPTVPGKESLEAPPTD